VTKDEVFAATRRVREVEEQRRLGYVGSVDADGALTLDGEFSADDLRALANAIEGK